MKQYSIILPIDNRSFPETINGTREFDIFSFAERLSKIYGGVSYYLGTGLWQDDQQETVFDKHVIFNIIDVSNRGKKFIIDIVREQCGPLNQKCILVTELEIQCEFVCVESSLIS